MTLFRWSRTAANNATIDVTAPFPEGMSASALNDSSRGQMAAIAKYRDDVAGAITTSGTATAYTVTSFQGFDTLANLNGQNIAFVPHATNTNAVGVDCNLSVDSLGNRPIRMTPGVALPGGTLILGTPYIVTFNNSDSVFYLQNMTNPYSIPLAGGMDFWGTTAPNSSFAFPIGQTLSRTTYATLFSIMGTTFGAGDGSTTFALPDKTGRISAMKEASATRLTSTYFGGNSTTLGAVGGADSHLLTASEIPSITSAGGALSASVTSTVTTFQGAIVSTNGGTGGLVGTVSGSMGTLTSTGSTSAPSVTSNNTGGGSHTNVQPTIVCNYIIRVI